MTDRPVNHEIAHAIMGGSNEPDRAVQCLRCKAMVNCPGFIIGAVKSWNRGEHAVATQQNRKAELISYSEMICCDRCAPIHREVIRAEYIDENNTTAIFLRELREGRYNPESLGWLRRKGYGAEVHRVISEEGRK